MNEADICNTIPEICSIAQEAGAAILQCYQRDYAVTKKEDCSPLTEADLAANEIITQRIESSRNPNISQTPILSEENAIADFSEREQWSSLWVVDPLDGTKEFINKNDQFTVNIGLVSGEEPIAGVIYVPALSQLYFAVVGLGAYCHSLDAEAKLESNLDWVELVARSRALERSVPSSEHCIVIGSRSHGSPEYEAFVTELNRQHDSVETSSAGSSLKFCRVAEGAAHIYPRLGRTMEWDTCAGHAIVRSVGLNVFAFADGSVTTKQLKYNKADLANPWFVVR